MLTQMNFKFWDRYSDLYHEIRPYLPYPAWQQIIVLIVALSEMTTTLRDLIGGKVIEANKQHIVISKDDKKFEIEIGATTIREMNKHQWN